MRGRLRGAAAAPAVMLAGYAGLGLAWAAASPPGSAPDEPAAHVKALAAGRGQLVGGRPRHTGPPATPLESVYRGITRWVGVPAGLAAPGPFPCFAFLADAHAGCTRPPPSPGVAGLRAMLDRAAGAPGGAPAPAGQELRATYIGTHPPIGYLAPGLLARLGRGPESSLLLARLANLATWLALVALAVLLAHDAGGGGASLLGPLAGLTPMAVASGATLSSSGPEIAAGAAFAAGLLRLSRPAPAPAWAWAGVAASGAVLATARPLGPVFTVVVAAVVVGAGGTADLRRRLRRPGARPALAVVVAGVVAGLSWQAAVQPGVPLDASDLPTHLRSSVRELGDTLRQMVGVLGWLDTRLPPAAYWAWAGLVAVLLGLAGAGAGRRRLLGLAGAVAGALATTVAVATLVAHPLGGPAQGRWVLPVAAAVALAAGEAAGGRRPAPRAAAVALAAVAAAVHLVAFLAAARRWAVGAGGPLVFVGSPAWEPAAGWWPWVLLATASAAALVLAAAVPPRRGNRPAGPHPPAAPVASPGAAGARW